MSTFFRMGIALSLIAGLQMKAMDEKVTITNTSSYDLQDVRIKLLFTTNTGQTDKGSVHLTLNKDQSGVVYYSTACNKIAKSNGSPTKWKQENPSANPYVVNRIDMSKVKSVIVLKVQAKKFHSRWKNKEKLASLTEFEIQNNDEDVYKEAKDGLQYKRLLKVIARAQDK